MNTNNLETLNEKYKQDFNTALNMYNNEYSHAELINFLKKGSIVEKQVATLMLDNINSKEDARTFITNLTGCDGKIREAVSFRLKEFIVQAPQYFLPFEDLFLEAIIDINGNICRNTIAAILTLKTNPQFYTSFCNKLCTKACELAKLAKTFDLQDGKYKVNKEIFKLYWYLETISEFLPQKSMLLPVIQETKDINDYTIREKVAKILSKIEDSFEFTLIKNELKTDENYYVRRF